MGERGRRSFSALPFCVTRLAMNMMEDSRQVSLQDKIKNNSQDASKAVDAHVSQPAGAPRHK